MKIELLFFGIGKHSRTPWIEFAIAVRGTSLGQNDRNLWDSVGWDS
jgi:hypothetical protein